MKRYSAKQQEAQGRTTHRTAPLETRLLVGLLNLPYPDGNRLIDRTKTKQRFRFTPGLAAEIGIPTAPPAGTPETMPPTELATVHETLDGLTAYIGRSSLSVYEIADELSAWFEIREPEIKPEHIHETSQELAVLAA